MCPLWGSRALTGRASPGIAVVVPVPEHLEPPVTSGRCPRPRARRQARAHSVSSAGPGAEPGHTPDLCLGDRPAHRTPTPGELSPLELTRFGGHLILA